MHTPRMDGTQLPSLAELLDILRKESQRKAVRFDFVQKNKKFFDVHKELSKAAGSDDSWIDRYEELELGDLLEEADKNHADLMQYIQKNKDDVELYKVFYTSLIPVEDQTSSDAIFVFGASTNARIEKAVELYKKGVAPKIVISGNSPYYVDGVQAEANRMAAFATDAGIPTESLILERSSITLPDNVKRTIDLFESMNWRPSSVTIIATNFVLSRAVMEWYKFCPWDIEIKSVAAESQSQKFTAEGWYKEDDSIALVLNEYVKLVVESKIDLMRRGGEI